MLAGLARFIPMVTSGNLFPSASITLLPPETRGSSAQRRTKKKGPAHLSGGPQVETQEAHGQGANIPAPSTLPADCPPMAL